MSHSKQNADETTCVPREAPMRTSLPQIVAPSDIGSPPLTARARKYRRINECPGTHVLPNELPVIARRPSSSRPDSSDTDSGRRERRFQCHQDLFATVLTPRSRSISKASTGSSRLRVSSSEDVAFTGGVASSPESSYVSTPAPNSCAGSRRPSNTGLPYDPSQVTALLPPAVLSPCSKISPRERQHAYKALRLLAFGRQKTGSNKDKLQIFQQEVGTQKQRLEFFAFWAQIDPDMNGRADFNKFMALLNRLEFETDVHRCYSLKLTSLLVNRDHGMVCIEDLMEAIWPDSTAVEKNEIWECLKDEHAKVQRKKRRVPVAPAVLDAEERAALECIFADLGGSQTCNVPYRCLAAARDECGLPMIDSDRLQHHIEELGIDIDNGISLEQFLVIMCPAGFRAFEDAQLAVHTSGTNIIRSKSGTWYRQMGATDSFEEKTVS